MKNSSEYLRNNNKKSNSDLRKIISSKSSSQGKSFDKTLPKEIHQSEQEKTWVIQSQRDQLKTSTKNSEKRSHHSQKKSTNSEKKTKSVREIGTDPINFDTTITKDK